MANPSVDSVSNKLQIIFVMFNVVLWSNGLVLLWFGVWLEVEFTRYIQLESQVVSFLLLSTGSLLVLFNSVACFCALKGESHLLNLYGLVLGVFFIVELLISLSMVWLKHGLLAKFNVNVNLEEGGVDMNVIQSSLNCCGLRGMEDWAAFNLHVPSSCCLPDIPNCDTGNLDNVWSRGCVVQMESFIDNNIGTMSLLAMCFAAVSMLGVIFSFNWAKKSTYEVI